MMITESSHVAIDQALRALSGTNGGAMRKDAMLVGYAPCLQGRRDPPFEQDDKSQFGYSRDKRHDCV